MDLKSSEPFWLIKNGLIQTYPSLREDLQCDVLVVGGGITGALISHQCVSEGYNTVLIDKREIGHGSSSATTSMLQYEIDTPLFQLCEMIGEDKAIASYKACDAALDKLELLVKAIKSKAGFAKKKSLYLASKKKDVRGLKKEFETRKAMGFDVRWMEREAVKDRFGIETGYGGILSGRGGSVDAFYLLHELLHYNQQKGLMVFDKSTLVNVAYKRGINYCDVDTGATIQAKKIVYCIGYESQTLIKQKFVKLLSTYAIVSEAGPQVSGKIKDILIWNTDKPYLYLRTTDDGRVLIGGEDEEFRDPLMRDTLLGKKEMKLQRAFKKMFPNTGFITDFSWTGTFGETKDGLPYIGTHKDFKGAYFVLGFGGNGITFSVTGMEMVSSWLKGKRHPLDEAFAFGR